MLCQRGWYRGLTNGVPVSYIARIMFFRDKIGRKSSEPVLQLVDGVRTPQGVKQRIVISLADLKIDKSIRKSVAKRVSEMLHSQEALIDAPPDVERLASHIVQRIRIQGRWQYAQKVAKVPSEANQGVAQVFVDEVTHTDHGELGPVLAGLHAWEELSLSKTLKKSGFTQKQIHSAMVSVINRLADPASEHRLPAWVGSTALPDLLDVDLLFASKDRFYRISDKLLEYQDAISKDLNARETSLFNLKRTIVLYDLTNTYFEGLQENNPKSKHGGKSKEKRNDCPQMVIALAIDGEGFVLGHRVYEGNTSDSTTLVDMVSSLREQFPCEEKPTVIVDGGISSNGNLKALRAAGFHYLVASRRQQRNQYEEVFNEAEFTPIPGRDKRLEVSVYAREEGDEVLLFCRSEGRANKEQAIHDKATLRFETDLVKLNKRLAAGRLKNPDKIHQSLGRLKERHHRVSRHYKLEVKPSKQDAAAQVVWQRIKDPSPFHGGYILRTSRKDLSPEEIWKTYITLTRVEYSFCCLKSDLGLRPVFHQNEPRCDAHIWITILAYHLLNFIQYKLRQQGDNRSWATLVRILRTHQYCTVVLPTVEGPVINLRRAGVPDQDQKEIYQKLGINIKNLPVTKVIV